MTSIFRGYTPGADDNERGFDIHLVLMTMEASQAPVLVRKDPEGDWLIIAQGPPGVLHAHIVTREDAWREGVPTIWDAAMIGAREHADRWRRAETPDLDREPTRLGDLLDALIDELDRRRIEREENPDAQAPDPS